MIQRTRTLEPAASWSLAALAEAGRGPRGERLIFDGRGDAADGWRRPGLVAVEPRCLLRLDARDPHTIDAALQCVTRELRARRGRDFGGSTGLAVLLGYECLDPARDGESFPAMVVLAVDKTIETSAGNTVRLTARGSQKEVEREIAAWTERFTATEPPRRPAAGLRRAQGPVRSLSHEAYVDAVGRLQRWIAEGRIYQANLCQRIDAGWVGEPLDYFTAVANEQPVPRSAFMSVDGFAIASFSPETFITVDDGVIETLPIKGTRPRGRTAEQDRAAIDDLVSSPKDRAELVMIIDLERNDIGRLCRPGSVEVPELIERRTYPAVHHLVSRVRGRLRDEVSWAEMVRAVFPGGSITGAPKKSAMDCLRRVEPVPRGPFTGSLFWCGDDGSFDSSILIRTAVFAGRHVSIGAGGGIVADSRPESEWAEANHKARPLTRALGFEPEEVE